MPLTGEWDPQQAHYVNQLPQEITIGAFVGLTAFTMVGFVAAFTYPAAAALPPALDTAVITFGEGVTVGTTTFVNSAAVNLSSAQMVELAAMSSGQLQFSTGAVAAILESWGFTALSMDGLLVLAAFDATADPGLAQNYGNSGSWLGRYLDGLGGGFATPPGFPGFPGYGYPTGTGGWVCYHLNNTQYCYWAYD